MKTKKCCYEFDKNDCNNCLYYNKNIENPDEAEEIIPIVYLDLYLFKCFDFELYSESENERGK